MNLIFLGPPGVGKGTYASRISPLLGIPHISTGDMFRDEVKRGSDLGKKAQEFMEKGLLVPDEIVFEMLKKRLQQQDARKGFILDGFPRTHPQAELLEKITTIEKVININLREQVLIQKIAARRVCKNCGEIYNIADIREGEIHLPPLLPKKEGVCDCGGELYQRDDDKEDVVRERLEVYKKQTQPLIDFYRKQGLVRDFQVTAGPEQMVPKIIELIKGKN